MIRAKYRNLMKEKSDKQFPEMTFYIEIPFTRPMIPILEVLKNEGIEYYIPPVDTNTLKYNKTKRIYMNVEDLEEYRKMVHRQISNEIKGVVILGDRNISEADIILGDGKEYMERMVEGKEL